jgi:hypothetical protein
VHVSDQVSSFPWVAFGAPEIHWRSCNDHPAGAQDEIFVRETYELHDFVDLSPVDRYLAAADFVALNSVRPNVALKQGSLLWLISQETEPEYVVEELERDDLDLAGSGELELEIAHLDRLRV